MIDVDAVRQEVTTQLALLELPVYPSAMDGVGAFPAIVLGMPSWQVSAPGATFCLDTLQLPIAVVVARPGHDDAAAVAELDLLWPSVLAELQKHPTFQPVRAEFGMFFIQGSEYPAQTITCNITT